jgi:hypothetical protein
VLLVGFNVPGARAGLPDGRSALRVFDIAVAATAHRPGEGTKGAIAPARPAGYARRRSTARHRAPRRRRPVPSPVRFPPPLRPGGCIGVTAFSSGVHRAALPRLELVLGQLRAQGYTVVEGECLRDEYRDASASWPARAHELTRFLRDPSMCSARLRARR